MLYSPLDTIDQNPKEVLDLYLSNNKCAGHYAYLLSHTDVDYSKSAEMYDDVLASLYFQILKWLDDVKVSLQHDNYKTAKNILDMCIDEIVMKVRELHLFNYTQDIVNIDYIIMAYTYRILSNLCQKYGRYKLGMDMYNEWLRLDTFIKTTHGYSYEELVAQIPKNPKQINAIKNKKIIIPLVRNIWNFNDISSVISPSTMANIIYYLRFDDPILRYKDKENETDEDKEERKKAVRKYKQWFDEANIVPPSVSERLKKDNNYILDKSELQQLRLLIELIFEKYKYTLKSYNLKKI